jgi:hypothetical protein
MRTSPFGKLHHTLTDQQREVLLARADQFFYLKVKRGGGPVTARYTTDGVAYEIVVDEDGTVCQSSLWTSDHESRLTPGS